MRESICCFVGLLPLLSYPFLSFPSSKMPCRLCLKSGHYLTTCPEGGSYKKAMKYYHLRYSKEYNFRTHYSIWRNNKVIVERDTSEIAKEKKWRFNMDLLKVYIDHTWPVEERDDDE